MTPATASLMKPNTFMNPAQQLRYFAWTPIQKPLKKWNIVRDDMVEVITGKYKKQQGKVIKVLRNKNQVIV